MSASLYKANSKTGRKTITKTNRNSNFPKIHRWTAFHITNDSTTCFVRNNSSLRKRSTVELDHSIPENSWKIVIGEVSSPDSSSGPRYTALVHRLSVRLWCRKTKQSHDRPRNGARPPFRGKGVTDATYEGDLKAKAGVRDHVGRESGAV